MIPRSSPHFIASHNSNLNTLFPLYSDFAPVKLSTKHQHLGRIDPSNEDIIALDKLLSKQFDENIAKVLQLASTRLVPVSKPIDYTQSAFACFHSFLSEQTHKFLLHSPENKEFEKNWQNFRCKLAYLRYDNDPQLLDAVKLYFAQLKSERLKIDLKESDLEKASWDIWENLLGYSQFLDVDFATLCSTPKAGSNPKKIEISVTNLTKAYWVLSHQLRKDAHWVIEEIEKQLTPFTKTAQLSYLNSSRALLQEIDIFKKSLFPLLNHLLLNSVPELVKNDNEIQKIFDLIYSMGNEATDTKSNLGNGAEALKNLTRGLASLLEEQHEFQLPNDHKYEIKYGSLREDDPEALKTVEVTLAEFETYIEFHKARNRCHILFDTYLSMPRATLKDIHLPLKTWFVFQRSKGKLKTYLPFLKKVIPVSETPTKANTVSGVEVHQMDINAQIAYIQGTPETIKKVKGQTASDKTSKPTVKPPRRQKENPATPANTPTKADISNKATIGVSNPATASTFLPQSMHAARSLSLLHGQILHNLKNEQQAYARIALRQSKMYLDDLLMGWQKLHESFHIPQRLFLTRSLVGASYYHLEQQLRYKNISENKPFDPEFACHWHNLNRYVFNYKLPDNVDQTVLKQIYLANFWIHSTFNEVALRDLYLQHETCEIPEVLLDLKNVALHPEGKGIEILTVKLDELSKKTVKFSEQISSQSAPSVKPTDFLVSSCFFSPKVLLDTDPICNLVKKCQIAIVKLNLAEDHPVACNLLQVISDLEMLKGVFTELNKPKISSDEFSPLVRHAVFWQNAVLQRFLQILFTLEKGIDTTDHDLAWLYQEIKWKKGSHEKNLRFLEDSFKNMNTISRYPFECIKHTGAPKKLSALHEVILQAELLREHPELNEGYKLDSDATLLNFVPVCKETCNSKSICETLARSWIDSVELITGTILPQLETF